jgi:four helix bundle protein
MMKKKESPLQIKSEAFTARIIKLYLYLQKDKNEQVISKQIYRSGTSIGANIAESRNAQSPADFVSKLSIALKESEETVYWLKSLHNGGFLNDKEFDSIHNDNIELSKMLTSSILTIKKKIGKL